MIHVLRLCCAASGGRWAASADGSLAAPMAGFCRGLRRKRAGGLGRAAGAGRGRGPGLADIACRATTGFGGWIREDLALTDAAGEVVPAWFPAPRSMDAAPGAGGCFIPRPWQCLRLSAARNCFDGPADLLRRPMRGYGARGSWRFCAGPARFRRPRRPGGKAPGPGGAVARRDVCWAGLLAELRAGIDLVGPPIPLVRADRVGGGGGLDGIRTLAFWLAALDPSGCGRRRRCAPFAGSGDADRQRRPCGPRGST